MNLCTKLNLINVQLDFLIEKFRGASVNSQLYNDLDVGIDYGCIFTSGCLEECNRCPLCITSKEQLVDVLSGNKREKQGLVLSNFISAESIHVLCNRCSCGFRVFGFDSYPNPPNGRTVAESPFAGQHVSQCSAINYTALLKSFWISHKQRRPD